MTCVYGETIYTGHSIVHNAFLVSNRQQIISISKIKQTNQIGAFLVLTTAFIDFHSHIGMVREGEPEAESEANDQRDTILAFCDTIGMIAYFLKARIFQVSI